MPSVQQVNKINRELQRLGMGKLSDPKLFDQMAFLVRDHNHFRGMLMHEERSVRAQMYQCLAPRLRFKAKPLEDYEAESKRIAEEKQLPQYNPKNLECREIRPYHLKSEEYKQSEGVIPSESPEMITTEFRVPRDEHSVLTEAAEKEIARGLREIDAKFQLTLKCRACTYEQSWRVHRKPSAYKIAKQDGWTLEEQGKKALCFACSKSRLN